MCTYRGWCIYLVLVEAAFVALTEWLVNFSRGRVCGVLRSPLQRSSTMAGLACSSSVGALLVRGALPCPAAAANLANLPGAFAKQQCFFRAGGHARQTGGRQAHCCGCCLQ